MLCVIYLINWQMLVLRIRRRSPWEPIALPLTCYISEAALSKALWLVRGINYLSTPSVQVSKRQQARLPPARFVASNVSDLIQLKVRLPSVSEGIARLREGQGRIKSPLSKHLIGQNESCNREPVLCVTNWSYIARSNLRSYRPWSIFDHLLSLKISHKLSFHL